jgi:4-hydroxybenzoyl-CoA thioesterase/acyl-CoA thioester hydrolase
MTAFQTTRRVEFRETDMAGIVHFSAFFHYMEEAEHAMLRHLGTSVMAKEAEGVLTWPRVSATCDYRSPVRFEDVLDVEVTIGRLGTKSVTYAFQFSHRGEAIAAGTITAVCCRILPQQAPFSVPIPASLLAQLRPYVKEQ